MSAQHTPGPWEFIELNVQDERTFNIVSYAEKLNVEKTERIILMGDSDAWLGSEHQARANIRLAAAAPELLEALQYLLEVCPAINQQGEEAHLLAREAIDSATFSTP
jgi:hypothetical protein